MTILRRRVSSNIDQSSDFYEVDAEIVVEDDGQTVYLHAYYMDDWDEVPFQALTQSIYDVSLEIRNIDMHNDAAIKAALKKRGEIIAKSELPGVNIYRHYAKEYQTLLSIIQTQIDQDQKDLSVYQK